MLKKKIAILAIGGTVALASTAQAGVSALSLRANTAAEKENRVSGPVLGGIALLGVIGMLEAAEAINLVNGGGDEPDSN